MELELIISGFTSALQPQNLLFIMIGLIFGIFIGSLPGMTATMGVAVMVPFSYYLEPDTAMLLMSGVFCGAIFGGSISAVLLGIPGTPASVPTAWEGFPMAKGEKPVGHSISVPLRPSSAVLSVPLPCCCLRQSWRTLRSNLARQKP